MTPIIVPFLALLISLAALIKGALLANTYSEYIARAYRLPKYTVAFVIVALISVLPETFIAVESALDGIPEFGLGTLFGSNIADLTLVFVLITLLARRDMFVTSAIIKRGRWYLGVLAIPLMFGFDGFYSRLEGTLLIILGVVFYFIALREQDTAEPAQVPEAVVERNYWNYVYLFGAIIILLLGAHFTIVSAVKVAEILHVAPTLVGLFVVSLGTVLPELFYSLEAIRRGQDTLATGDILGTVLADATIIVGVLALIQPFSFPITIIYFTGIMMLIAASLLFWFMKTDQALGPKEAYALFALWALYIFVEFLIHS